MKAPVIYHPLLSTFAIGGKLAANEYGRLIDNEVEWVQRGTTPRREAFYCKYPTDYFYGDPVYGRSYAANTDIPPSLSTLWQWLEMEHGVKYEACFLNKYEHAREHLGWHADDSDSIDDSRPIAVISFGAERELWFRPNALEECKQCNGLGWYDDAFCTKCNTCNGTGKTRNVEKLLLENGSLALMLPGMQDTHQHRIPKHHAECGTRISLTFRGLVNAP